jgi:hypothetical protein
MEAYVRAALALIGKRVHEQSSSVPTSQDDYFFARFASLKEIEGLPEYQRCLEELNRDQRISEQLDVMIGTNGRRSRSPSAHQLLAQIPDMGMGEGGYVFDAEHFDGEYKAFEEAYYSSNISYEVIAPLQGLLIDEPLDLDEDLRITWLKDGDINPYRGPGAEARARDPLRAKLCMLRTVCHLPKVVGDDIEIDVEAAKIDELKREEVNDRVEQVVGALRLCGIESVFPTAILHRTSQWSFGHDRVFPGRFQPDIHFATQADGRWMQSFKQFWHSLRAEGVKRRKFLDLAIRRYSYAHERHRLEDKIIDLLIAAESLFLSDYNKDDPYIGEIRYRLSLRAALFTETGGEARKKVFRQMRAAYDLRSTIAHGGDVTKVKIPKRAEGGSTPLEEFVWTIQAYMRFAICKAVGLAASPDTPTELVRWDELIFNADGK